MTDLISKIDELIKEDVASIQAVVNKYSVILQDIKPEKEIPYQAYIIGFCDDYIAQNHKDVSTDIKAWSVFIVRNHYLKGKLINETQIPKIIDDFIEFWKTNYEKYCKDIIAVTEYDKDRGFVFRYEKKIGS